MDDEAAFDRETVEEIENILGYSFRDRKLLERCFTLASKSEENNERLEFLGDAVLEFCVSEGFYRNTRKSEGEMTRARQTLVSDTTLYAIITRLGLQRFLLYEGTAESNLGKKPVASLFEALTAGIYLDGGIESVYCFLRAQLGDPFASFSRESFNYKGRLQEYLQGRGIPRAEYSVVQRIGQDHCPVFTVEARAADVCVCGTGSSKKEAEQAAAHALLDALSAE